MPLHCCVTGCRGNYRASKEHPTVERVSVFKFPDDTALREKWLRLIPRENIPLNDKTVVCEKHFSEQFIIRIDTVRRDDGTILSVPRGHPKLTADAVPTLFPNTPSYLSSEPPKKRKAPDERRADMSFRDEQSFQSWMENDSIGTFDE